MMTFTKTRNHFAPWIFLLAIAAVAPGCSGSTGSGSSGDATIPAKYQAFAAAFDQAGIKRVLRTATHGEWIELKD